MPYNESQSNIKMKDTVYNFLKKVVTEWNDSVKYIDRQIVIVTFLLMLLGLMMIFSATTYVSYDGIVQNPIQQVFTQSFSILIGILVANIVFMVPEKIYRSFTFLVICNIILILLLMYVVVFTDPINGAKSWIQIRGFSFQPSEFSKIFILMNASYILVLIERETISIYEACKQKQLKTLFALTIFQILLIFIQPDKGMTFLIFALIFILATLQKFSLKLNALLFVMIPIISMAARLSANFYAITRGASERYFLNRIIAYPNPFRFGQTIGYQLIQAYTAISNGGLFGVGLGNSALKHSYLPAAETDFILAIIAEELGLIGVLFVFVLYIWLIGRLVNQSTLMHDSYRQKILLGFAILFFLQVVINVGGLLGLIPLTGITLPFLSYGGTSMLMLVLSVSISLKIIADDRRKLKNQ